MKVELTVSLPPEKARQHLLKYLETREDTEIEISEPDFVLVRVSGWSPFPWMKVKIRMFTEENRTRLTFDFGFRMAWTTITLGLLAAIVILGSTALIVEPWWIPIGFLIGTLFTIPIATALDNDSAKRKFLGDIRKAFDMPSNKN